MSPDKYTLTQEIDKVRLAIVEAQVALDRWNKAQDVTIWSIGVDGSRAGKNAATAAEKMAELERDLIRLTAMEAQQAAIEEGKIWAKLYDMQMTEEAKVASAKRDYLEKSRHLMAVIHTESQTALEAETKKQLETIARIKQAYIALGLSKIQLEQAVARETALALAGSVDEQMTRANEFFSVATVEQEKLNKAAEELGTRLGLSLGLH
jgi:hypothetical protein